MKELYYHHYPNHQHESLNQNSKYVHIAVVERAVNEFFTSVIL